MGFYYRQARSFIRLSHISPTADTALHAFVGHSVPRGNFFQWHLVSTKAQYLFYLGLSALSFDPHFAFATDDFCVRNSHEFQMCASDVPFIFTLFRRSSRIS